MPPERWEKLSRAARQTVFICTEGTPEWIVATIRQAEPGERVWVQNDIRRERYAGTVVRHMGGTWWNVFVGNLELTTGG